MLSALASAAGPASAVRWASWAVLGWAGLALGFTAVTLGATDRLRRLIGRRPAPARWPDVVLLRPCEGAEADLERNLASSLCRYPGGRRVLLLVPSEQDPSCAVARAVAAAAPAGTVEVIVTGVTSRRNRKSAHLAVGLERALAGAAPEVIIQADSDVLLDDEALPALVSALLSHERAAAAFAAPVEDRGTTLGDLMASGLLSASHQDFFALSALSDWSGGVTALSGALAAHRTEELLAIGGFAPLEGLLGEDFEVGRRLLERGRRAAISARSARCAGEGRRVADVVSRTARWSMVVRRQRGALIATYPLLLAPTPILALLAMPLALAGAPWPLLVVAVLVAARATLAFTLRRIHGLPVSPPQALALALGAEVLMLLAFPRALASDEVVWRGRRLRVGPGGRIDPVDAAADEAAARAAAP